MVRRFWFSVYQKAPSPARIAKMMIFKNFFINFSFYAADAKMSPQGQLANISVRQVTRNETISQGLRPVAHFANVIIESHSSHRQTCRFSGSQL